MLITSTIQKKWTNFSKHKLLKLNHDEINNLNSPVTAKEIEFIILKLEKQTQDPNGFSGDFYKIVKE